MATPNITSFLIEPFKDEKPKGFDLNMLQGDSQLIIVAGRSVISSEFPDEAIPSIRGRSTHRHINARSLRSRHLRHHLVLVNSDPALTATVISPLFLSVGKVKQLTIPS